MEDVVTGGWNCNKATPCDIFAGAVLLTAADAPSLNGLFLMFVIVQAIYGIGVGGEYPTASSAANERANSSKDLQKLRGRTVVLVFSNQGLGNLLNTLILLILMAIFHQYGPKYNQSESPSYILSHLYMRGSLHMFALSRSSSS